MNLKKRLNPTNQKLFEIHLNLEEENFDIAMTSAGVRFFQVASEENKTKEVVNEFKDILTKAIKICLDKKREEMI